MVLQSCVRLPNQAEAVRADFDLVCRIRKDYGECCQRGVCTSLIVKRFDKGLRECFLEVFNFLFEPASIPLMQETKQSRAKTSSRLAVASITTIVESKGSEFPFPISVEGEDGSMTSKTAFVCSKSWSNLSRLMLDLAALMVFD